MTSPRGSHSHRTPGSWIPRVIGTGVVVLLVAGGLAAYVVSTNAGTDKAGGSTATAGSSHSAATPSASPSLRVISSITTGLVDFGPYDDNDAYTNDPDDHPLMLRVSDGAVRYLPISPADLSAGVPTWTANQMSDGSYMFIDIAAWQCLTAPAAAASMSPAPATPSASASASGSTPSPSPAGQGSSPSDSPSASASASASPAVPALQPSLAQCDQGSDAQRWHPLGTTTADGATFSQFAALGVGACLTAGAPGDPATLTPCAKSRSKAALPQEIAFFWKN